LSQDRRVSVGIRRELRPAPTKISGGRLTR
jgi:hypothetical protein